MDNSKKSLSPQRKFVGRKDKQRLKEIKKMQLEQERLKRQKQEAEFQLSRLKSTGLVNAYQSFLRSLCVDGLPQQSILYEKAAQYILQFEKKMKHKQKKKEIIENFNSQILRKSRSRSISPSEQQQSVISSVSILKKREKKKLVPKV